MTRFKIDLDGLSTGQVEIDVGRGGWCPAEGDQGVAGTTAPQGGDPT